MTDYVKYFAEKECSYWHEYPYAYRTIDFRNRQVLMIGGDCGSSALYFIIQGASRVITYEKEEKLRKLFGEKVCHDFGICNRVEVHGEWKGDEYPKADVFIMDCEGCEDDLEVHRLSQYSQWCVAIHDWAKKRVELLRAFAGNTFTFVSDDGREIMLCRGDSK